MQKTIQKPKLNLSWGFKCHVCNKDNSLIGNAECMGCGDTISHADLGLDLHQMNVIERLIVKGVIARRCKSYQEALNFLLEKLDKGELEDVREHQKNLHDVANTLRKISSQMNSCNKCQEKLCVGIVGKDIKAKLVKKQQKDLQKR